MNGYLKKIASVALSFIVILNMTSCAFGYYRSFEFERTDEYSSNADSDFCWELLKENGFVVSLDIDQAGNDKKHELNFSIKSFKEYQNITLQKAILCFDGKEVASEINKTVSLNSSKISRPEILENEIYADYIFIHKLNMTNKLLRSKQAEFPIRIKIIANFDDEPPFECEYHFTAKKYLRKKQAWDLYYMLFPGV